jgi:hypothetical protein
MVVAASAGAASKQVLAVYGKGPRSFLTCLRDGVATDLIAFSDIAFRPDWIGCVPVSASGALCCGSCLSGNGLVVCFPIMLYRKRAVDTTLCALVRSMPQAVSSTCSAARRFLRAVFLDV